VCAKILVSCLVLEDPANQAAIRSIARRDAQPFSGFSLAEASLKLARIWK